MRELGQSDPPQHSAAGGAAGGLDHRPLPLPAPPMDALISCLTAAAPLGAALGLGWFLRRTRACSPADGEVRRPWVAWGA